MSDSSRAHHVVIVGAGFGGLEVAHRLAGAPVRVTIIDQRNHHLFQPLLYQVATASLATSEIAWPVRHLLRKRKEVTTLLAVVTGVDSGDKKVLLEDGGVVAFDYSSSGCAGSLHLRNSSQARPDNAFGIPPIGPGHGRTSGGAPHSALPPSAKGRSWRYPASDHAATDDRQEHERHHPATADRRRA